MNESRQNSGKFLLDTTAVIDILRGRQSVVQRVATAEELFISVITLGELYYGAYCSRDMEREAQKIESFIRDCTALPVNKEVAKYYGWLKNNLRSQLIPENDLWIVATALVYDLPLIAKDEHFQRVQNIVPDIKITSWE